MFTPSYKGNALGWQGYYYFNSVLTKSWYLGGRIYYENYRSFPHALLGYTDQEGTRSVATFGFQAKHSRYTVLMGLGYEATDYKVFSVKKYEPDQEFQEFRTAPMLEFKVGYEI